MRGLHRLLGGAAGLALALGPGLPSQGLDADRVRLGTDVQTEVRGATYSDKQVVSVGPAAAGVFFDALAAGLPPGAAVDAVMVISNVVVFSTDVDCVIQGTPRADEDLICYRADTGQFSLFFDGSAAGIPAAANLDAVCWEPGSPSNWWFSLDIGATLPGSLVVDDDDVIRRSGSVFSVAYDGTSALTIPRRADLDALYADASNLYFSLDCTATIGGRTGTHNEVWVYNRQTAAVGLLTGFRMGAGGDLTVLDCPEDRDGDWLTDYEEASGVDEAASSFPGTNRPLDPGGYRSDADVADTDSDGLHDGQEAACGTDPRNAADLLRMTAVERRGDTNVVTWQSVPGKQYALDGTPLVAGGFTNPVASHVAGATATNRTAYGDAGGPATSAFYRVRIEP